MKAGSAAALGLALLLTVSTTATAEECTPAGAYRITGYTRGCCSPRTYDGTSVYTPEKVVAASWNLPIGTRVRVEGLDYTYRVADRGGGLEARHIDVLVDTQAEAYAIESYVGGKYAQVCIVHTTDAEEE